MNRRIQVEELPSGELIISTNFVSGLPGPSMRFVKVCDTQYGAGKTVISLLEHEAECPFQTGLRRLAYAQERTLDPFDEDYIPF